MLPKLVGLAATLWLAVLVIASYRGRSQAAMTIALNSTGKWPGGIIPFRLDQRITNFSIIQNVIVAMKQLEQFTGGCIKFRRHNGEADFIIIQDESYTQNQTCFSYVGRTGAWQPVRFSANCLNTSGDALNLLVRVVGLYPESNRPDRDQYISVQWDNILQEKVAEYSIIPDSYQIHIFHSIGYDFASITHHTQWQFSRNPATPLPTWVLRPGVPHPGVEVNGTIGQRVGLSMGDVAAIRYLYNCNFSATITPDVSCRGDTLSQTGSFQHGKAAGWFFCKCNQNNITGDTYFFGERCQYQRCTPDCSHKQNSYCAIDESGNTAVSTCTCNYGWSGTNCDTYYCPSPCLNGGVCVNAAQCLCPPEYPYGNCATQPQCYPSCENGGDCIAVSGAPVCRCQIGWTGSVCTEPACNLPCLNQGICVAPNVCDCPKGYTGLRCENSNVTYGLPCTNDYDCQYGWGDLYSYCNTNSSCPGVNGTCVCSFGYERLPTGGVCRYQRQLGDSCSWMLDICQRNSECIEGVCQCNEVKGWVKGPLNDCVKASKNAYTCKYWDDCLYNKTCNSQGQCVCPAGMLPEESTSSYTCRARVWAESCSTDEDCKYVGVGAVCKTILNTDGSVGQQVCDCPNGVLYEYLIDRYHVGKTCVPPFPQKYGERCSRDFSKQPKYGPCERGLLCELCPRSNDEYRCQYNIQPGQAAIVAKGAYPHQASHGLALVIIILAVLLSQQ